MPSRAFNVVYKIEWFANFKKDIHFLVEGYQTGYYDPDEDCLEAYKLFARLRVSIGKDPEEEMQVDIDKWNLTIVYSDERLRKTLIDMIQKHTPDAFDEEFRTFLNEALAELFEQRIKTT